MRTLRALLALLAIPSLAHKTSTALISLPTRAPKLCTTRIRAIQHRLDADNDGIACKDFPTAGTEGGNVPTDPDEDEGDDAVEDGTMEPEEMPDRGAGGLASSGSATGVTPVSHSGLGHRIEIAPP